MTQNLIRVNRQSINFSDIQVDQSQLANYSELQLWRQKCIPNLPNIYKNHNNFKVQLSTVKVDESIAKIFPVLFGANPSLAEIVANDEVNSKSLSPLRIGVVLSGGQAAGGHNVIAGVYDFIKKHHSSSQLFGFLDGPIGIYTGKYIEINDNLMDKYRNQGGFDMIRSGRHKIETPEQFSDSLKNCSTLLLDGLIIIGGDDSNTNACLLAEYFAKNNSSTTVVGVPKTIDGDLKNEFIEVSFGYDTATKLYSECIGNICLDTLSSKKYYHFIRLMGRSASHISLECGLLTRPNLVLVGEEVQQLNQTLMDIVNEITRLVVKRHEDNKDYGVILVPEGLIEFIPEVNVLIKEINEILHHITEKTDKILTVEEIELTLIEKLSEFSKNVFLFLPKSISKQLMLDRDPHGNVQVSKIDTEKLLILLIQDQINKYNEKLENKISFSPQSHFFGYEGRCALPSLFDTEYCYSLGYNAGLLVNEKMNGYMSIIRGLKDKDVSNWRPAGCPLMCMMNIERRKGKDVPVIKKALVELDGDMFKAYSFLRETLKYNDSYTYPGPIQYQGDFAFQIPYLVYTPQFSENDLKNMIVSNSGTGTPYSNKNKDNLSELSNYLVNTEVLLPNVLQNRHLPEINVTQDIIDFHHNDLIEAIKRQFPYVLNFQNPSELAEVVSNNSEFQSYKNDIYINNGSQTSQNKFKIAIVYNGRQAPGGNNIIRGMLEFKKRFCNENNYLIELIGFKYGTDGFFNNDKIEITEENYRLFHNHGGFDYLGRSKDKIRSDSEKQKALEICNANNLNGLILVGASHTLSDALILSEYFIKNGSQTKVIGIPCTVDGNISHPMFEMSIGFDTASKVYSSLIGNIMTDSASNTKYWYFIRLMGRNPSHLVLECALQTHPNYIIISEEIAKNNSTLEHIVGEICDVICERARQKKNFGTVLIPEGLISYLPYFTGLIDELNKLFSSSNKEFLSKIDLKRVVEADDKDLDYLKQFLSPWSAALILTLPVFIRNQLLFERESSGGIQLSQIETEKLISYCVEKELARRKKESKYIGSFSSITHFFGYQGRCSYPSLFDQNLATSYGYTACLLAKKGLTAYCVTAKGLTSNVEGWILGGIPLTSMCSLKSSNTYGISHAHIASSDVNLKSNAFIEIKNNRRNWVAVDHFRNPGPIQFYDFGKNDINITLKLNNGNYKQYIDQIEKYCLKIKLSSTFGVKEEVLQATLISLENLDKMLKLMK